MDTATGRRASTWPLFDALTDAGWKLANEHGVGRALDWLAGTGADSTGSPGTGADSIGRPGRRCCLPVDQQWALKPKSVLPAATTPRWPSENWHHRAWLRWPFSWGMTYGVSSSRPRPGTAPTGRRPSSRGRSRSAQAVPGHVPEGLRDGQSQPGPAKVGGFRWSP